MQEWLKIERVHALTSEYRFISNELAIMRECWEATQDHMCTEQHQQLLESKLTNIWKEIQWIVSSEP